jgi:hypothetical protein
MSIIDQVIAIVYETISSILGGRRNMKILCGTGNKETPYMAGCK